MRTYTPRRATKRWLEGAPPEVLGCWDNGGKTIDRYTVALGGDFYVPQISRSNDPRTVPMLAMSGAPTHPQGFSQWTEGVRGPHLGKKIRWHDLPAHIQRHVWARITEARS